MNDKFLVCGNCVRWGLPWSLQNKMTMCHERKDGKGKFYNEDSPACRYFIPKRDLPKDLQTLRLLTQALSPTQLSYMAFAIEQAQRLLNAEDIHGTPLALGDLVEFEVDDLKHYGTVDGMDPKTKALWLWSPSFPKESVQCKRVERIERARVRELLTDQLELNKIDLDSNLTQIKHLRSRPSLTEDERQELLHEEEIYAKKKSLERYLISLKGSLCCIK